MADTIQVTRSSMPDFDEYINEIRDIWDSRLLTNVGPKHKMLEQKIIEYLNVKNVQFFTNGHMALEVSMQALGLKGEVITTPFTFASTTNAIVRNGAEPVFCDINPNDYTIDADKIEALITDKTTAIVPVHVYGNVCDVEKIENIAKKHNLKVIYDAAHAFGVKYKGTAVGNFGDASCFSFHATKVFNTIEGGAVCFADKDFGTKVRHIKNFGIAGQESVVEIGTNAKMNEFCAAMGLCNLRHIDDEIGKRKAIVERYNSHLADICGITVNAANKNTESNYAYYPILVDKDAFGIDRDELFNILAENNIFARKYFYPLTNTFESFSGRFNPELTPIALKISKQVLTLPLYADLSLNDVDRICETIVKSKG